MKKYFLLPLIVMSLAFLSFTVTKAYEENKEVEAIKELVLTSYVHGAFNELNPEAMKEAFHPDFAIFSAKGDELARYEIEDWVESVSKRKNDPNFDPAKNVWDHRFGYVDVTGVSAALKLEYLREGKMVYTDYISLLKFGDEWKIVAKVYHYHGEKKG